MPPKKKDTEAPEVQAGPALDEQPDVEAEPVVVLDEPPAEVPADEAPPQVAEPTPVAEPAVEVVPCGECMPSGGLPADATSFACAHGSWAL